MKEGTPHWSAGRGRKASRLGTSIQSSPTGEMFTPSVTFDPTFTIIDNLLYGNLSEVSFLDRNPELPLAGYCNVDYEINRNQF